MRESKLDPSSNDVSPSQSRLFSVTIVPFSPLGLFFLCSFSWSSTDLGEAQFVSGQRRGRVQGPCTNPLVTCLPPRRFTWGGVSSVLLSAVESRPERVKPASHLSEAGLAATTRGALVGETSSPGIRGVVLIPVRGTGGETGESKSVVSPSCVVTSVGHSPSLRVGRSRSQGREGSGIPLFVVTPYTLDPMSVPRRV